MSIISKETWDKFTQEEKERVQKLYEHYEEDSLLYNDESHKLVKANLESIFPEEVLHSKPLTYEDVEKELFKEYDGYKIGFDCVSLKQTEKLLAINRLLNVAKYLNKDQKPDWSDTDTSKWSIELDNRDNKLYPKSFLYSNHSIVYFPSMETAEKAIQILGEDTVRLALKTNW